MTRRAIRVVLLGAATLALAACATVPAERQLESGASRVAGFHIWFEDGGWHLRGGGGTRLHRYQGTLSGTNGSVTTARPTSASVREQVALVGDAVQFDFEASGDEGFDAKVAGGCIRLDLFLDGKRRPDRVHAGAARAPAHIPFELCPDR